MTLAQEDIEFIKQQFTQWLAEQVSAQQPSAAIYDLELRERMLKVEEELRHQRELMQQSFIQVDKQNNLQREEIRFIAQKHDRLLWALLAGMAGLFSSQLWLLLGQ